MGKTSIYKDVKTAAGGKSGAVFFKTAYESPIGTLTLISDGEYLIALEFPVQRYPILPAGAQVVEDATAQPFAQVAKWLDDYFAGKPRDPKELPLDYRGTDFRNKVWRALLDIPFGQTISYGELAQRVGTGSARATGGAVGHNPISIIGPCHRVVGANRSLTGFGGGIKSKIWLLEHEGCDMDSFTVPTKGTAL